MAEKSILYLLIICGILCKEIVGISADEDISESSDSLVRKKRVINLEQDGRAITRIETVPYIVDIREFNRSSCVGAILSHYTVLTAATCFNHPLEAYNVQSGSGYVHSSKTHVVTSKSLHFGNRPRHINDGIALITIDPPFEFNHKTAFIALYTGNLLIGTVVSVTGWGCHSPRVPSSNLPRRLRTITVPIMDLAECLNIYPVRVGLSLKHICTYDEHKLCANTDIGAPLVIRNRLAGVHVYRGDIVNQRNPDVFINVQHPDYSTWIRENTLLI